MYLPLNQEYILKKKIGIRLEDDVVINLRATKSHENIPILTDEIESMN